MEDHNVRKVVILGSKPDSFLPDIKADVVIAANSAVELAKIYRDRYKSRIISLTPCNHLGDKEYIQNSIKMVKPDELVILGECIRDSSKFAKEILNLEDSAVQSLKSRFVNWTLLKQIGFRCYAILFYRIFQRGLVSFFNVFLTDFFGDRDFSLLARSTGVNGILYAMHRFENVDSILIAGIGLQAGGHFNSLGEFTDKTAQADRLVFTNWPQKNRNSLVTTDEMLSKNADIEMWSGGFLY